MSDHRANILRQLERAQSVRAPGVPEIALMTAIAHALMEQTDAINRLAAKLEDRHSTRRTGPTEPPG